MTKFQAAAERNDPALTRLLERAPGLLDWDEVRRYNKIDPGNAKPWTQRRRTGPRRMDTRVVAPSMPYYETAVAHAEPDLRNFTKRLIFSGGTVVRKAIAVMLNYEAERRAIHAAAYTVDLLYEQAKAGYHQFGNSNQQPSDAAPSALSH